MLIRIEEQLIFGTKVTKKQSFETSVAALILASFNCLLHHFIEIEVFFNIGTRLDLTDGMGLIAFLEISFD